MDKSNRNTTADIIRGLAMIMVISGHVITVNTYNGVNGIVYNVIWSLQMPLFMLISGFFAGSAKNIESAKGMANYLKKKTIALLLPFCVWTFLIRGLVFGQTNLLDLKNFAFNMDQGYWFLFSLWTISVIFGVSEYFANKLLKLRKGKYKFLKLVAVPLFCGLFSFVLLLVGLMLGLDFLSIKLTLYYTLFFMAGHFYSEFKNTNKKMSIKIHLFIAIVIGVIYILLIANINTVALSDTIIDIALRLIISFLGSVFLCELVSLFNRGGIISSFFAYVGEHTLEIYVSHYIFCLLFWKNAVYNYLSLSGVLFCTVKIVLTLLASLLTAYVLNKNRFIRFIIFGKK